jgi:hypothetical protein
MFEGVCSFCKRAVKIGVTCACLLGLSAEVVVHEGEPHPVKEIGVKPVPTPQTMMSAAQFSEWFPIRRPEPAVEVPHQISPRPSLAWLVGMYGNGQNSGAS